MNLDFYSSDTFVESPLFDNWFKKHYPQKSLLICSPYIKQKALSRIVELYDLNIRDSSFELNVLMRGNPEEFTYQKSSDISIFSTLRGLSCFSEKLVRRIQNLHMKAYLIDGMYLLISSGNLTNSGIFALSGKENFEGGISVCEPQIINNFFDYFSSIWSQSESMDIFYPSIISAYQNYLERYNSEQNVISHLTRQKFIFPKRTVFDIAESTQFYQQGKPDGIKVDKLPDSPMSLEQSKTNAFSFTISDIPPVGKIEHILPVLRTLMNPKFEKGITYLELGKALRPIFSSSPSTSDAANRKFGEEKGKFAVFFNLASIHHASGEKLITISDLGKVYLQMTAQSRKNLIKDVFFEKDIVVSILHERLKNDQFELKTYLLQNCQGASELTLSRKISPLNDLFDFICSICTEEELLQIKNM